MQRIIVNVAEEVPWCVSFQSPHSSKYCAVAQFIASSQEVEKVEDPKEGKTDRNTYNMIGSGFEYESDADCIEHSQDIVYRR